MSIKKRTPPQIEADRLRIAQLYLRGLSHYAIAAEIGTVTRQQISYDLKLIRKQWLDASFTALEERRAEELAKIDALEVTYWTAWEKSCRDAEVLFARKSQDADGDGRTETSKRTEGQYGDPRFLAGVERCIAMRCKLFGLDEPKRIELLVASAQKDTPITELSSDELMARIRARGTVIEGVLLPEPPAYEPPALSPPPTSNGHHSNGTNGTSHH